MGILLEITFIASRCIKINLTRKVQYKGYLLINYVLSFCVLQDTDVPVQKYACTCGKYEEVCLNTICVLIPLFKLDGS